MAPDRPLLAHVLRGSIVGIAASLFYPMFAFHVALVFFIGAIGGCAAANVVGTWRSRKWRQFGAH